MDLTDSESDEEDFSDEIKNTEEKEIIIIINVTKEEVSLKDHVNSYLMNNFIQQRNNY